MASTMDDRIQDLIQTAADDHQVGHLTQQIEGRRLHHYRLIPAVQFIDGRQQMPTGGLTDPQHLDHQRGLIGGQQRQGQIPRIEARSSALIMHLVAQIDDAEHFTSEYHGHADGGTRMIVAARGDPHLVFHIGEQFPPPPLGHATGNSLAQAHIRGVDHLFRQSFRETDPYRVQFGLQHDRPTAGMQHIRQHPTDPLQRIPCVTGIHHQTGHAFQGFQGDAGFLGQNVIVRKFNRHRKVNRHKASEVINCSTKRPQ